MAEKFDITILQDILSAHIADSTSYRFNPVTTGKFNTTYFVDGGNRPLVLRIAPPDDAGFIFYERGMMAQEPAIHKIIRERTTAPVAEIIAYDDSRRIIDRDYLIMERLPGTALSDIHCTMKQFNRVLEQTGSYLRQIHSITATSYGYFGEHKCMEPQSDWASAFYVMWNKLVDGVVMAGYYDEGEETFVRGLLDKHYSLFDRSVTSRLLHMDIWSQNILVDSQGNVSGLVDFDRALWGDKEIEFAVLDYCGISEPAFWRGYGLERDVSEAAQVRRLFYLLYEIQKYIIIRHYRSNDPVSAKRYKQQSLSLMKDL